MQSVEALDRVVKPHTGARSTVPAYPEIAPVPTIPRDPAFIAAVINIEQIRPYALGALCAEKGDPCCPSTYYPSDVRAQAQYQAGYYETRDAGEINAYLSETHCTAELTDYMPRSPCPDPDLAPDWAAFVAAEAEDLEEARLDEEFWARGMW